MKLREYKISTGKLVLLGKSAENNEELISQASKDEIILHTSMPGSPFANIKDSYKNTTSKEIYEAGTICAKYSQDWRDNKKSVMVHYFLTQDVYKTKNMKVGTFGVKKCKEIKIKKQDILELEKN